MSIHFVYFDAAGTLLRPEPSVGEIYARACRPHGLEAAPGSVEAAFRRIWKQRETSGDPGLVQASPAASRRWWCGLVEDVLDDLGFAGDRRACFEACYRTLARPQTWHVFSDVIPTLRSLRARGLGLGVLSNWDHRLPALLQALGLLPHFGPLVISALEGVRKPDPRLFAVACRRAGVPAQEILHVGDRRSMDLEPARRAGMSALLVDRTAAVASGGIVRSLLEIPARLHPPSGPGTLC